MTDPAFDPPDRSADAAPAGHGAPGDARDLVVDYGEAQADGSGVPAGLEAGTVAGAIEGAFFGKTSVAVSLAQGTPPDYNAAARYAVRVIRKLLDTRPPAGSLWNLNLPETEVKWSMREAATRRMLVAEASKFRQSHLGTIGALSEFQVLVTG